MREKELRRSMSVFPIGTVMKLTDLTARQIRYYEEQELIHPERSDGNRRMYSLNDIDTLLEIKDYLSDGFEYGWDQTCVRDENCQRTRSKRTNRH